MSDNEIAERSGMRLLQEIIMTVFMNRVYGSPYWSSVLSDSLSTGSCDIKVSVEFRLVRAGAWHSDPDFTTLQSAHI